MSRKIALIGLLVSSSLFFAFTGVCQRTAIRPGTRTLMDAHNCYPYGDWWADRIDRALSAGTPLAIEQDLSWYTDPKTGKSWSVVAHATPLTGHEPTLQTYFFDRIRPIAERALRENNQAQWPLITLNLDFKDNKPEHIAYIWAVLQRYQAWLTTAPRTTKIHDVQRLHVGPILVLTGDSDAQQKVFYDQVPVGGRLLVFGAVHTNPQDPMAAPDVLEPESANNYRRWWNNPWNVVEKGGQTQAGGWTGADFARLKSLVQHAHANGLWIRFYTLDGATTAELSCRGWFPSYNFGSVARAEQRWRAAYLAKVDYLASDEYELVSNYLQHLQSNSAPSSRQVRARLFACPVGGEKARGM